MRNYHKEKFKARKQKRKKMLFSVISTIVILTSLAIVSYYDDGAEAMTELPAKEHMKKQTALKEKNKVVVLTEKKQFIFAGREDASTIFVEDGHDYLVFRLEKMNGTFPETIKEGDLIEITYEKQILTNNGEIIEQNMVISIVEIKDGNL